MAEEIERASLDIMTEEERIRRLHERMARDPTEGLARPRAYSYTLIRKAGRQAGPFRQSQLFEYSRQPNFGGSIGSELAREQRAKNLAAGIKSHITGDPASAEGFAHHPRLTDSDRIGMLDCASFSLAHSSSADRA